MKMVVAVVRDEYAATLTEQLTQKGFGATKLASTGGFLKAGNTTFLIGVPAAQLEEAMTLIRNTCPTRQAISGGSAQAGDLQVSGATVFVLDVERMVKV